MTKFLLFSTFLLCLFFESNAQIEITLMDMPKPDSSFYVYYRMEKTSDFTGIDTGAPGENVSWNFSTIKNATLDSSQFVDPAIFSSPIARYFPGSNIAEIEKGKITFYSIAETSNKAFVKLLGISDTLVRKFTTQLVKIDLPITYGKQVSSIGIDTAHIASNSRLQEIVSQKNNADAWGTITTPYRSYESLRLYSLISSTKNYQTYANGTWTTQSKTVDTTRVYSWWAKEIGKEVFKITYSGASGNTITNINWFTGKKSLLVTGNQNTLAESNIYVGPNPSNGNIQLSFTEFAGQGYRITLLDLLGKEKYTGEITANNSNYNFSSLPDGTYLLKVTAPDGKTLVKKISFKN